MPAGKSFAGEKLLIDFNTDALRAMEHQADLIAIAYDIRLKQRRPIDLNDRELVSNNFSRFHGYLSGGSEANADKFFKAHGLNDFYWGLGRARQAGEFWVVWSGRRPADADSLPPDAGRLSSRRPATRPPGPPAAVARPDQLPGRMLSPDHARYYGMTMGDTGHRFLQPSDDQAGARARVSMGGRP